MKNAMRPTHRRVARPLASLCFFLLLPHTCTPARPHTGLGRHTRFQQMKAPATLLLVAVAAIGTLAAALPSPASSARGLLIAPRGAGAEGGSRWVRCVTVRAVHVRVSAWCLRARTMAHSSSRRRLVGGRHSLSKQHPRFNFNPGLLARTHARTTAPAPATPWPWPTTADAAPPAATATAPAAAPRSSVRGLSNRLFLWRKMHTAMMLLASPTPPVSRLAVSSVPPRRWGRASCIMNKQIDAFSIAHKHTHTRSNSKMGRRGRGL